MDNTRSRFGNIVLQSVLDASLDAAVIIAGDGRILEVNRTTIVRYGYSRDELLGMNVSQLSADDHRDFVRPKLRELMARGEIFEWQHRTKDGIEIPVEIYAQPLDLEGETVIFSNVRDIRRRKKIQTELAEQKHFLERILDTEPGTVYIFDLEKQQNVYVNRHWFSLFGYTPEETQDLGPGLLTLFHPDDLPRIRQHHEAWQQAASDEMRHIEFRVRCKSGEWLWLNARETPFTRNDDGIVTQILGIAHDITPRKLLEKERELFVSLANNSQEFIGISDLELRPVYANPAGMSLIGLPDLHALKKIRLQDFFFPDDQRFITEDFLPAVVREGGQEVEIRMRHFQTGAAIWVLYNVFMIYDMHGQPAGLAILSRNIHERKRWETLLKGQTRILEMIATGVPLAETLDQLVRMIESQSPGMLGSILLLDPDGIHVRHGAAPSLPAEFINAVDGQPIGPVAGSCGTAAYRKAAVYVEDIATDPLWAQYREAALPHGLHACWSTPIIDGRERVLGTFAMYYPQPGLPTPEHLALIATTTHIAQIAISRYNSESELRLNEERLRLALTVANQAWFDINVQTGAAIVSDDYAGMIGFSNEEFKPSVPDWLANVHPSDRAQVAEAFQRCIDTGGPVSMEYRRRTKMGDWLWMRSIGKIVARDSSGNALRMIGIFMDISQQKRADEKVRRMTQLYAALSQCNQAIVRCNSEEELFPQICRDAVVYGGMTLAWIGMLDPMGARVIPVAAHGSGQAFLQGLEVTTDGHLATGRGPTGIAVREKRPYWCQDFRTDPALAPWRDRAAEYGWHSMASLPLYRRGDIVGALIVYSDALATFDEPARRLLEEMAMDISFALDRFVGEQERRLAEEALRVSEQHLRTIVETEPECVKVVGRDGALIEMNQAGLRMLEVDSIDDVRARGLLEFVAPEYRDDFLGLHQRVLQGDSGALEFEIIGAKGTRRWLGTHAAPMRDAKGGVSALLGITRDITEHKSAREQIQYMANYDALTGLPNRVKLAEQLSFLTSLMRRSQSSLAVLFLDIDRFKDINDTLGHSIGDALLLEIATRLRKVLRDEDTPSRMGGDEFILVLPDCDAACAARVAQKLLQVIAVPFQIEPYDLVVSASIGIAIYPEDGEDLESLSKSADTAMYRAKLEGRNCYRFFTPELQSQLSRNMQLATALRHAVNYGELSVFYQPQMSVQTNSIIGMEALLRWQHPEFGAVSPGEFIPIAESSGLIIPIGEWALRTAAKQARAWMNAGVFDGVLAVNLSAVQFRHPDLPDTISRILQESGLPPDRLELELTEGATLQDPVGAITVMDRLHAQGVRMSIDDFGTGYSSLSYLKKFKLHKLKIDQSFVRDITTDPEDRAIVTAIINLGKNLGLKIIAEGVETEGQLGFLQGQHCDEVQGYYFSKPLSAVDFERYSKACHREGR